MSAVLIDTNVLVYAHDRSEAAKQRIARDVIARLAQRQDATCRRRCSQRHFVR
jgi:predicted nucleic acid-binding protein